MSFELAEDELAHFGTPRHSGRYPWGSGKDPYQSAKGFLGYVAMMRAQGLSDTEIARGMGLYTDDGKPWSTTYFRALNSSAKNEVQKAEISEAIKLKEKGLSNVAIGKIMGKPESSVRDLLKPSTQAKVDRLTSTANVLKQEVADKKYLDVGLGTEHYLGVSDTQLKVALQMLREEGYNVYPIKKPQLGTGEMTTYKVLVEPGVTYKEFAQNSDKIRTVQSFSEDGGETFTKIKPPSNIKSKRVMVRYGDEGGSDADGVIELRRGVEDISLGNARYAQVRIAVDGTHYLKGMAMYADDLPDGVDIRFNTNKTRAEMEKAVADGKAPNIKLAAMKKQETSDPNNPFGSSIQRQSGALNIVNEEGKWSEWSNKFSSQFLSKQPTALAKEQLAMRYDQMENELASISRLTNPEVKKKLLQSFADSADSSAVHLKAAGLPRTNTHVILPINSLKDNEIYAPNYNNGETVVLVRHPHGGIFEIPELTVNNKNKDARRLIPNAIDAVGINSNVAARLSGADFDGDTVLVIPNNQGRVKTAPALAALKDFDPKTAYPKYEGMQVMSAAEKQHQMGNISNLITDMSIGGATQAELARAVRHSMVVIDAEKHELNYKQSYLDNNIAQLKKDYQGSVRSGASTLISRASSDLRVPARKPRPAAQGGFIDKNTGEKMYVETGETYPTYKVNKKTGEVTEVQKLKTIRTTKLAEAKDAYSLVSDPGTPIEFIYADYSNKMKALANRARKEMVNTPPMKVNPSAKATYKPEVDHLKAQLNRALKNAPLERVAQVVGNAIAKSKADANPSLDKDDLKRIKYQALEEARLRVGAQKTPITISDREWEAIQSGAVSSNILQKILQNTDLDRIKELATPRNAPTMTTAYIARAKSMLAAGYTQAEVASALGVSVSTLNQALK